MQDDAPGEDDEMPTETDPLEAHQTYVDDRDAGHGDMGFTLEDFVRHIAEMRQRRKQRLPKEEKYRLFETVVLNPTLGEEGIAGEAIQTDSQFEWFEIGSAEPQS